MALWSIKDHRHPVAVAIREVVVEEMLHMSLVCNILKATGGNPRIYHPSAVPLYPRPMPGGVKPELTIELQGLNKNSLEAFMEIEEPGEDISELETAFEAIPRIGVFYNAIMQAVRHLNPELTRKGQLEGYFGESRSAANEDISKNIGTIAEIEAAIELIKDQGEGTSASPFEAGGELAHYYRFKEIAVGRKITRKPDGGWAHTGEPVPMPECWPVGVVPSGGYSQNETPPEVWDRMTQFNELYSQVLQLLDQAWQDADQGKFHHALEVMMERLPGLAREIMQAPVKNKGCNYGPAFQVEFN